MPKTEESIMSNAQTIMNQPTTKYTHTKKPNIVQYENYIEFVRWVTHFIFFIFIIFTDIYFGFSGLDTGECCCDTKNI